MLTQPVQAQHIVTQRQLNRMIAANTDSIQQISQYYASCLDSLSYQNRDRENVVTNVLTNPYYAPILGNMTLYNSTIKRMIGRIASPKKHEESLVTSKHIYQICDESDR